MKKIIEMALPLKKLSVSSMGDKLHKGHPGNMHLWWNRSPVDASTALLKAVIENASSEEQQSKDFNSAIHAELATDGNTDTEATPRIEADKYPIICDPFSGFGGLAIAAQKAGLNVQAGDLNAVATLLTKAVTEIPSRFADARAVNPASESKMYFGAEGIAADVKYYGGVLKQHAEKVLAKNYQEMDISGKKFPIYSWIWVRTMECQNPACRCHIKYVFSLCLPMVWKKFVSTKAHTFVQCRYYTTYTNNVNLSSMLLITFLWLSGQLFYVHFTKHKIISKTPSSVLSTFYILVSSTALRIS